MSTRATLVFAAGTLELRGRERTASAPPAFRWDERTRSFRAPGLAYAETVLWLRAEKIEYDDEARRYAELEPHLVTHREPRPFQTEALAAFRRASGRGVVVLPTGAGKSHVAVMAIDDRRRSALVVVPTLDLVRQWYDLLRTSFATTVGIVGGGSHDVRPLTVTTYDSAYLHMEHFGARFGLSCSTGAPSAGRTYRVAAGLCSRRFGWVTTTPERPDGAARLLA
jgi:hypothetical protein